MRNSAKKEISDVQVNVGKDLSTVTIGDSKVEVSADGKKVIAYTKDGVETKETGAAAGEKGTKISISEDFNAIVLNGVTIEQASDGHLVITAPGGTVITKPAPANDTSAIALLAGAKMADGSVFAGMTADGKQQIYAMPKDLSVTTTFNDAAEIVKALNRNKFLALGHDDWQIPGKENLLIMQKNQNEGALKGTFNTSNKGSGSGYPGWYWSSTEHRDHPSDVWVVRFSDGYVGWYPKDYDRLSCRPVRLVDAKRL